jgi:hypothetical protein
MIISIINHTQEITDQDVQQVLRAINRQIEGDFEPYWSLGGRLRLEGRSGKRPSKQTLNDMRGGQLEIRKAHKLFFVVERLRQSE